MQGCIAAPGSLYRGDSPNKGEPGRYSAPARDSLERSSSADGPTRISERFVYLDSVCGRNRSPVSWWSGPRRLAALEFYPPEGRVIAKTYVIKTIFINK